MGLGPVPATKGSFRVGINISELDLIELNEAFGLKFGCNAPTWF